MKFTQRNLAISILVLFNISAFVGLALPSLLYAGTYSPPIETEWSNFERHYAVSSFSVDLSSFNGYVNGYTSYDILIHVLKLDSPLIMTLNNGSSHTDVNITGDINMSIFTSWYIHINSANDSNNSEIILTIDGITNSSMNPLIDSKFLRFGRSDNFFMDFQDPVGNNNSNNKYYVNLNLDIREINGSGSMYVGQDNELGDYYIYSKLEINSTGNYSVPLKINHHSLSLGYSDNFFGIHSLSSDSYSKIVWDVQGKIKFEIKSYETFFYGTALLVAYIYLFSILGLDVIVLIYKSISFLNKKSSRNQYLYNQQHYQPINNSNVNLSPPMSKPNNFCPNCGCELLSGKGKFCPSCGKKL